ncbi:MAG TPA: PIN domain-containing protein [Thermoanaerobaculia bacterium]|nr:PIN domain-containing protein [Thermoanaerobaculia bacterium]
MIAVDSSSLRRYFDGRRGSDVSLLVRAADDDSLILPPVVVAETLSDPGLPPLFAAMIQSFRMLELRAGYWVRTGELRAATLQYGYKAKLADVLIAQSCIDHDVPLITYDADFRHFTRAGLKLA